MDPLNTQVGPFRVTRDAVGAVTAFVTDKNGERIANPVIDFHSLAIAMAEEVEDTRALGNRIAEQRDQFLEAGAAGIKLHKDAFKNFHRSLCARFGYVHDPVDWQRDQVSLEEHIAHQLDELRKQVKELERINGVNCKDSEGLADQLTAIGNALGMAEEDDDIVRAAEIAMKNALEQLARANTMHAERDAALARVKEFTDEQQTAAEDILIKWIEDLQKDGVIVQFCQYHNREFISPDETCHECVADGASGELCDLAADSESIELIEEIVKSLGLVKSTVIAPQTDEKDVSEADFGNKTP